jgi:hypothetical protein
MLAVNVVAPDAQKSGRPPVTRILCVHALVSGTAQRHPAVEERPMIKTAAIRVYSDSAVRAGTRVIRAPSALSRWSIRS